MLVYWENFWYFQSTLAYTNGYFLIFSWIFDENPLPRILATLASVIYFSLILKPSSQAVTPLSLNIASLALLQFLFTSYGVKFTLKVAVGLTSLPLFLTSLLCLRNYPFLGLQSAVVFALQNLSFLQIFKSSAAMREDKVGVFQVLRFLLGLTLLMHSIVFLMFHKRLQLQRHKLEDDQMDVRVGNINMAPLLGP